REELEAVLAPAVYVAADVVGVVGPKLTRPHGVATDNPLPQARSESLDLVDDPLAHVHRPPVRDVAVGPHRVLSLRRPGGVEEAVLREQHEGSLRIAPLSHLAF